MKKTKLNLENIQGKLSRTELKNFMAGNETNPDPGCYNGPDCYYQQAACVFAGHSGKAYSTGPGIYDWKCCC